MIAFNQETDCRHVVWTSVSIRQVNINIYNVNYVNGTSTQIRVSTNNDD